MPTAALRGGCNGYPIKGASMHAVELRNQAIKAARSVGIEVREDWFDGRGGGVCRLKGRAILLLDLAQTADEQLEVLLTALREEPQTEQLELPAELRAELAAA